MWTREIFGMDLYHLASAFLIYSVLGWCVESIYMSLCNRKVTNRGFAKGPFCPIYGFGGVVGYLVLRPLAHNYIQLFLVGALLATTFEFLVGKLMIFLFGELWWDYNSKPCNYKGIVCLESTVAWGFYALIIVLFLHTRVIGFIDRYPRTVGQRTCMVLFLAATVDFVYHLLRSLDINVKQYRDKIADKYQSFKTRWY